MRSRSREGIAASVAQVAGQLGRMRQALSHLIELSGMIRREVEQRLLHESCGMHAADLLTVAVDDPGCIADLDTPDDYERLLAGSGMSSHS